MKKYVKYFLIALTVIVVLLLAVGYILFFTDLSYQITVSRETTVITEPLLADGRVDYGHALNKIASRGVTPETNALIPYVKLAGNHCFEYYPQEDFNIFCERIGVKQEELKLDFERPAYTVYENGCNAYADQMEKRWTDSADDQEAVAAIHARLSNLRDEMRQANNVIYKRAWTAEEFPFAHTWIRQNDEILDAAAEAFDRPHWYRPLPKSEEQPFYMPLTSIYSSQRHFARLFSVRAMLHIGEGRLNEAWQDIRTIKRMAWHIAKEPCMTSYLTAQAIGGLATKPAIELLAHPSLPVDRRREIVREMWQLKFPMLVDSPAWLCEHYASLEIIQSIPRHGIDFLDEGIPEEGISPYNRAVRNMMRYRGDWDELLKRYSEYYKELTAAMKLSNHFDRAQMIKAAIANHTLQNPNEKLTLAHLMFSKDPTDWVLSFVVNYLHTVPTIIAPTEEKKLIMPRLLEIVARLTSYRAARGEYPERLEYLATEPIGFDPPEGDLFIDLYTETDTFRYKKNPDGKAGYLIYSIGINGTDDNGRSSDDDDSDDIAIHVGPDGYIPPSVWNVDPQEQTP